MEKKQARPRPQTDRQQNKPAKRRRFRTPRTYREFERLMSRVLGIAGILLLIYLIAAARDVGWLKGFAAVLTALSAGLSLGFLYLNRELNRPRSRWLTTGFLAILVLLLVSLVFRYPRPAPTEADITSPSTVTVPTDTAVDGTDAAG